MNLRRSLGDGPTILFEKMCRYQKIFVSLQRVYRASKPWQKVRLKYSFVEKIASFRTNGRNMIPVLFACNVLYTHNYRHKTYRQCSAPVKVSGDTFNKAKQNRWLVPFIEKYYKHLKYNNNMEKTKEDDYEYCLITVYDEDGYGWDQTIDEILSNGITGQKEHQVAYLNDIIRDIEHYRDYVNSLDPSDTRFGEME